MPKFLDAPQWYGDTGSMEKALGIPTYLSPKSGSVPVFNSGEESWNFVQPQVNESNISIFSSWYAPVTSGDGTYQVLCGGMPTPEFKDIYVHCFSYKITNSSVQGWLSFNMVYPSKNPIGTTMLQEKLKRFNSADKFFPVSGMYVAPSIGDYSRLTTLVGIYWTSNSFFAMCGIRNGMYMELVTTFSINSVVETGCYSISSDTL